MPNINNPHDLLFKETLTHKENAVSFLGSYLPEEILQIIDLETIEVEKDSFVTDELREFFTDLLYKTRLKGREGYIYVLFEHKSHSEEQLLKTDGKIDYEFFKTVTIYILSVTEIEVNDYVKIVREILSEEGGKLAMTTAQRLFREGEIQGEIRGEIRGILDIKFGQEGLNLIDKIKTIEDLGKLAEIKTAIKKADRIEEVARLIQ